MSKLNSNPTSGFTIVEIMMATVVFSIILLIIVVAVSDFTRSYYKGVNSSSTQAVTQNIVNSLAQALQFSNGGFQHTGSTYCIGSKQFDYAQWAEVGTAGVDHGLWETPVSGSGSGCSAATPGSSSQDLLGPHMRLQNLSISLEPGTTNTYDIDVQVVYGDDNALCDLNTAGDCASSAPTSTHLKSTSTSIACKPGKGEQFCYVAELSTTVQSRVQPL